MDRWLKRLAFAALALAVIPLQGCSLSFVTIAIPDFSSKAVQGVWLWRLSDQTGLYEREAQFTFQAPVQGAQGEKLDYSVAPQGGSPLFGASTYVVRDEVNPDQVYLQLIYGRDSTATAAYYRASTYNQLGDSPLTAEIVPL
jgi:hypothetical protein